MGTLEKRRRWIDYVKMIACILVVLGHFFQSMTKSNLIQANDLYKWFNQTIYYFHVPLFFVCSGYLYQKHSKIRNLYDWKINVVNKFIGLGVPYFVFSAVTWTLKTVFSGATNSEVEELFTTLFLRPIAPYWYLYCLFFLFVITPQFKNEKKALIGVFVALLMKVASFYVINQEWNVYLLEKVFCNEVWFVFGMTIAFFRLDAIRINNKLMGMSIFAFFALSVVIYLSGMKSELIGFGLGIIACESIISLMIDLGLKAKNRFLDWFSKYTMPIFLMHTVFAALIRSVLIKIGVINPIFQVMFGLTISFLGPIICANIMEHFSCLNFLMYPSRYLKLRGKNEKNL